MDDFAPSKKGVLLLAKTAITYPSLNLSQNTPLSSTEFENGTVVGKGVAFTIMNILRKKFNFTYEVILPTKNFELGDKISDDSIIGLLNTSVSSFIVIKKLCYDYSSLK